MKRYPSTILLILFIIISYCTYVNAGKERPGVRYENVNILVLITDKSDYIHRFHNPNFELRGRVGSANVRLPVRSFKEVVINGNSARIFYRNGGEETLMINPNLRLSIGGRTLMLRDCRKIEVRVHQARPF